MAESELASSEDTGGLSPVAKVTLPTLTAMVVGSMVGAGVFTLPARFGRATGVFGALIAWTIAGVGILMLAFVFQNLAIRKPELDAGLFAYAKAGFGDYIGFNSAFGFWLSACVGNVFYWVFIMTTIGAAFPAFGKGDTLIAMVLSSIGVWLFHYLIQRGVREAATINRIVTVAKVLPIVLFIIVVGIAFKGGVFTDNWWGEGGSASFSSLYDQVTNTMIVTVFVFLGVEGATVYSRYAKKREDVGKATVLGFLSVLAIFSLVTLVSYGVLPQEELANARQPSMASVMESVVGTWGAVFISIGLVVSVLGAYLAWTLMAAEMLFIPAKSDDMPRFLRRENRAATPITALILSTILIQVLLFATLTSEDALNFMLDLCTSLALLPYFLTAAYAVKIALTRETYESDTAARTRHLVIGAVATIYTLFLIYTAGMKFLLLSCILYAPGTILYVMARRENGLRIFRRAEMLLCAAIVAGGVVGVVSLVTGAITI